MQEGSVSGANHETGQVSGSWLDVVALPLFRDILGVVNLVEHHSPVESLSTGRSITWTQLGAAFAQTILLLGGALGLTGMVILSRRELAAATGSG